MTVSKMLSFLAHVAASVGWMIAAAGPASAQQQREWHIWQNVEQCSMTRQGWLAPAQDNPGIGGIGSWLPVPGDRALPDVESAFAELDAFRLTSPWFRAQCCKVQVWSDPTNGQFAIAEEGQLPGSGFTMVRSPPICCEDAALIAGFDPFGCRSVTLMSVPGVTIRFGPTGPVSPIGPVTIPSTPPLTIAGEASGDGGVPAGHAPGQYLGCFRDTNNPFNLDGYLVRSGSNTPEACVATCRDKGFRYAGVEFGESCLCGNDGYDRAGPADNCDMACTGDAKKICGGYNANSVYATGL